MATIKQYINTRSKWDFDGSHTAYDVVSQNDDDDGGGSGADDDVNDDVYGDADDGGSGDNDGSSKWGIALDIIESYLLLISSFSFLGVLWMYMSVEKSIKYALVLDMSFVSDYLIESRISQFYTDSDSG